MMLVGHLQKCDATEPILRISLDNIQQQVGISHHVLEAKFLKYNFLAEHSWFKHEWKFLHEIGGSLSVPDAWIPKSPYENDNFRMDMVMSINIPNSTIANFNLCRLQKQMHFFTDTSDSKNINLHSLLAHPDYHRSNNEKFPMIQVPNSYWKIWSNILRTLQASVRVSGYYPGRCVSKKRVIWLQKYDRSQLMQKIEEGKYRVYFLQSTSRKIWKYHKHTRSMKPDTNLWRVFTMLKLRMKVHYYITNFKY